MQLHPVKLGCLIVAAVPFIWGAGILAMNSLAYQLAKNECATLQQVEIIDRALWDKAKAAYFNKNQPARDDWAFELWPNDYQDEPWLPQLSRSRTPVTIMGKLVAYDNDVGYFPYVPLAASLLGGRGAAAYQCAFHEKQSAESQLISNFNKFAKH